jgi:hypothetical protein
MNMKSRVELIAHAKRNHEIARRVVFAKTRADKLAILREVYPSSARYTWRDLRGHIRTGMTYKVRDLDRIARACPRFYTQPAFEVRHTNHERHAYLLLNLTDGLVPVFGSGMAGPYRKLP